jgi:hypothetical protein
MLVFRFCEFPSFLPGEPEAARLCSIPATCGWPIRTMLIVSMLLGGHALVHGQVVPPTETPGIQQKSAGRAPVSRPAWRDLSTAQQQALNPLASTWDGLSENHKRKWLALSRNHAKLSPADQAVQHSRMKEWATLSQQQRAQARFNFAEVKQLPADERKAKWEAYQALSPEEKRKLAERAPAKPPGVAPTIKPVPARKLAPVRTPAPKSDATAPLPPAASSFISTRVS